MTSPAAHPSAPAAPVPAAPSFPELYERVLVGPLFAPWASDLLGRVPLGSGATLLDVACGTGVVARLARARVGPGGRVVGVDRSPAMLAVARRLDPSIDWREGGAEALPLREDERFDVAACHQGLQFFDDRAAATREMRRAVAPGGHVAIGVWGPLAENGLFHDLVVVAERFVGPIDDRRHSFTDGRAIARLLSEAGFDEVRVEHVTREVSFDVDCTSLVRLNAGAVVGMTERGRAMSDAERAGIVDAIVDASVKEVARWEVAGALRFPTAANLATARAP